MTKADRQMVTKSNENLYIWQLSGFDRKDTLSCGIFKRQIIHSYRKNTDECRTQRFILTKISKKKLNFVAFDFLVKTKHVLSVVANNLNMQS